MYNLLTLDIGSTLLFLSSVPMCVFCTRADGGGAVGGGYHEQGGCHLSQFLPQGVQRGEVGQEGYRGLVDCP